MKIVPNVFQHGAEWHQARNGIPTASEFKQFMDTGFELRKGDMLKTYIATKVAERLNGKPLPGTTTFDMDRGTLLEEQAVPWFALEYGVRVKQGLFITNDTGTVGASPDGLIPDQYGIEIKCPSAEKHVRYLLDGRVPNDYLAQVHGSLWVTGMSEWKFVSYYPSGRFPKLVIDVKRDEEIISKIGASVAELGELIDAAMARLRSQPTRVPTRARSL